jgi:hypothetical protein
MISSSLYFAFLHLSHWPLIFQSFNVIGVQGFEALCHYSHESQLDHARSSKSYFHLPFTFRIGDKLFGKFASSVSSSQGTKCVKTNLRNNR